MEHKVSVQDATVRSVLEHWAPRFMVSGVDYADFTRLLSAIRSWDDWCQEWSKVAMIYEELATQAIAEGNLETAGSHLFRAALYYHFAKFFYVHDPDSYTRAARKSWECYQKGSPYYDPPAERVEIPFGKTRLPGYLRRPSAVERPPVVVLITGLDSTKEENHTFEEVFLRRGMATLSFDGPGQGEVEEILPMRPDWEAPVAAVLDFLVCRADVDGTLVGLVGRSLGGYYALRAAAFDGRVRAVAESSGPFDFGACWETLPLLSRSAFRYRSRSSSEEDARIYAKEFTLRGVAHRIACPVLIVHGKQDRVIPWAQAVAIAEGVGGPKELVLFEEGGHGCNNLSTRYRPLIGDWMRRQFQAFQKGHPNARSTKGGKDHGTEST
ncbi:MAG: alpha/beta hydrolase [Armatimonadota bacterium]|nr:alpha/beta hydrolase [Armatimonadota bacterium]MDR5704106.1 alpha/beta hydrolase [Armatimonadota bacterium]